jgi:hypothetical protein
MKRISERSRLTIDEDAYAPRARPHHAQILVNLGMP